MTSEDDLRLLEDRVRGHFGRRAAAVTPDTLGPARPPRPEPARRRLARPGTWGMRTIAPLTAGLLTVGAVAGWVFLAPDHDGSTTVPPGESVTVPAPDPFRPPAEQAPPATDAPAPTDVPTSPPPSPEPVTSAPVPTVPPPTTAPEAVPRAPTAERDSTASPTAELATPDPTRPGAPAAARTGTPPGEPRTAAVGATRATPTPTG